MDVSELERLGVSLDDDVKAEAAEAVALRRDFHRHPEVGWQEQRTQQVVLERLAADGVEARPLGGTGVVATVGGAAPGPVVLLRSDMDALPVTEESDAPYRSEREGVMHACGHDAHLAMLLTTARLLVRRGLPRGSVKLMFQPAEEGGGGAARMIEEGVLESPRPDASVAFHVWSGYPLGRVVALDGPAAASVDGFVISVRGRGTHAATPEDGVDPVLIAAQIITAAQALVTRRVGPFDPTVLTFTAVHGGEAFNVIPGEVQITGTIRAFERAARDVVRHGLEDLAQSVARSLGGGATYASLGDHGPVINDPRVAGAARDAARRVVGDERVVDTRPLAVGEDIGLVQERVPGALVLLGCADPRSDEAFPHHHPRFDVDERVLPIGVQIALGTVERLLD